ncbi:MAG: ORF6N domain-containing protein, partial [Candidatus Margulisbacteria bacterium]|nr:ORF6N domain-containing protein [Candidatus Margulisiibacteriota bacterium]
TTKRLNEQVKRNKTRFPKDFMFQINKIEKKEVVAICDHLGELRYSYHLPYAFTEHGAIMLVAVLNSERAMKVSVYVVRAFVRFRKYFKSNLELKRKIEEVIKVYGGKLKEHDQKIAAIFQAINNLLEPVYTKPKNKIGFLRDK